MNPLEQKISEACASTAPKTKARMTALKAIRWVLARADGAMIQLCVSAFEPVKFTADASKAAIFDGRDNEQLKAQYF